MRYLIFLNLHFFSVTKTPESCKWSWRFDEAYINFLSQLCKQFCSATCLPWGPEFGSIPWGSKWAGRRASTQAVLVCSTRWGPLGLQGSWFYLAPERTWWRTCLRTCTNAGRWFINFEIDKVEKILKGSLDLIPSPSPSVNIQIMCGKVCLRCKGKTLLGVVNNFLKTKSLLTSLSNVLPNYLSHQ